MVSVHYIPQALTFSPSQKFFSRQKNLMQKLGFISVNTIDFHIKYSFQQVEKNFFIQGAEFETFDSNHSIIQQGMLYKIGVAHPKHPNILWAKINLTSMKERMSQGIRGAIRAFPLRERTLFILLLIFLPKTIGKTLAWINIIGVFIMLGYSLYKTFMMIIKGFQEQKKGFIGGFDVQYAQQSDQLFFSPEMLNNIQKLKNLDITQIAYTGNCLYCYQNKTSAALTQHTIQTLQSPELLSLLTQEDATQS